MPNQIDPQKCHNGQQLHANHIDHWLRDTRGPLHPNQSILK